MAKVSGPLVSLGARGQLAKTLVFSGWKGIPTARQYVVPANPRSAGQVVQRGYMADAVDAWHTFTATANDLDYAAWILRASQLGPMSGFNAFAKEFLDERVATPANVWNIMNDLVVTDYSHNSLDLHIDETGGATDNITFHYGATAGFQGNSDTAAAVAGERAVVALDTGLVAGADLFCWFSSAVANKVGRSGLYRLKLT